MSTVVALTLTHYKFLSSMGKTSEGSLETVAMDVAPVREKWIAQSEGYYQDIASTTRFFCNHGNSVLEVGCSTGWLLRQIGGTSRRLGVDKIPELIQEARQSVGANEALEFRVVDFEASDCDLGEKFDLIVFSDLFSYSYDAQRLLENARRHLNPGGRVLITAYNAYLRPLYRIAEMLGLKRQPKVENWFTRGDIENLADLSGFETIRKGNRGLIPWKLFGLGRLINRWLAPLPGLGLLNLYYYTVLRPRADTQEGVARRALESVSVIVPARNEAGNIEAALQRLPRLAPKVELIFVEGNSTDDTWARIQELVQPSYPKPDWVTVKAFKQSGKGKADAVHLGFARATGDVLLILDADLTVQPEELPRFVEPLRNGSADFVHGCRLVYPMEGEAMQFLNMIANTLFGMAFTFLLGQRFKDTLCGTKVFWREDWEKILELRNYFGDFDPFGDFEMIFGAVKLNHKIAEIPVHYKARTYGSTNIQRWHHGWILLKMLKFAAPKMKFV